MAAIKLLSALLVALLAGCQSDHRMTPAETAAGVVECRKYGLTPVIDYGSDAHMDIYPTRVECLIPKESQP